MARWQALTPLLWKGPRWLAAQAAQAAHARTPERSLSRTATGNKLSRLGDHRVAACGPQRMVFLFGRRNSGCSLGVVWQRVAGFFSGCSRGDGLRGRSLPFFQNCVASEQKTLLFPPNLCLWNCLWGCGQQNSIPAQYHV